MAQCCYAHVHGTSTVLIREVSKGVYTYIHPHLRSLEVTTQEYGKKWAALSSKKLFKIAAAGIKIAAQFMDTVHSKLNLHPIQIIGMKVYHMVPNFETHNFFVNRAFISENVHKSVYYSFEV